MRIKIKCIPVLSNYHYYTYLIILVSIFDLNFSVFVQPGISLLFTLQSYGGADRLQGPGKATIWENIFGTPSTNQRFGLS